MNSDQISAEIENSGIKNVSHLQSSTSSEYKSELRISSAIRNIKRMIPRPMKISLFLLLTQIVVLIVYALIYYKINVNYIDNYFKPTQNSLISFCQQYHFIGLMLLSNTKIEYISLNIIDINERPEYKAYMSMMYNTSMRNIKIINYQERNTISDSDFERNYKETQIKYVDHLTFQNLEAPYIEFVDIILNNVNDYLSLIRNSEFAAIDYNELIFLCRNFPNYLSTSVDIYTDLQTEFFKSDDIIDGELLSTLIIFLIIFLLIKIWEVCSWNKFISVLKNLFIIFLRVNDDDIGKELENSKDFLQLMKDSSDTYFHSTIFDFTKREKIRNSASTTNLKAKNKKKNFFSRFKGLPKLSILVYLLICSGISSLFFTINYYNWTVILKLLEKLIHLDIVFSNTYIYSASASYLEDLLLREKIIRNPEYEKLNDTFQTKNGRISYFSTSLDGGINFIGNTSALDLITDGFETSESIKDINQILNGNLCELIGEEIQYDEKNDGKRICETLLNGAFKNGIGNAFSEFIKNIKSREETLQYFPQNANEELIQKEAIKNYVKSLEYFEIYLSYHYLHSILKIFFNLNNIYYSDILEKEQLSFFTFLYISLVFVVIFNIVIIYLIKTKVRSMYTYSCLVLSFIPYERLTKDEQILNFLKKFLKKNE